MRYAVACTLLLLLGGGRAAGQPTGALSSFQFLQLEPSARAAALGGAMVAVADGGPNVLFYNPATPGTVAERSATLSYLNHLADMNAGTVAYSHTASALGTTLSGGVRFASWGEFQRRDAYGEPRGTFGANDAALTLGASRGHGDRLRYGANMHLLHAQIERVRATAVAFDLGGLYRWPEYGMSVGTALRNAGAAIDGYGDRSTPLPLDLQVGGTKQLAHLPLLVSLAAYDLTNLSTGVRGGTTFDHVLGHLIMGAELRPGDVLRLRVGYNHRRSRELALTDRFDFAGVGLGFGIHLGRVAVDYAYNSWSSLGGMHQFTVRARLGGD